MKILDYIVVGSGCSGAIAAETLVEAGVDVTMIDAGINNSTTKLPPGKTFLNLREHDKEQYKYFIGEHAEGINWGIVSKGAQLTPPRLYMTESINENIPLTSKTFSPLESLGYGGLGIGWGVQCWEYSDVDLKKVGLDPERMRTAYETVGKRIGISATKDAASTYTIGTLKTFQPSAQPDKNHRHILQRYLKWEKYFQKKGVFIGRTPLALLTRSKDRRQGYRYLGTDFYSDADQSAWRPWMTVNKLRQKKNFHYIGSQLVVSFSEKADIVTLNTIDLKTNIKNTFYCRNLVLASGALGTARIVLRSQAPIGTKTPLLSNPHSYIPAVQPHMFGKGYESKKLGFGQVSYFIDPDSTDSGISVASSYGYQSLMLFRIISQIPFNFSDGRILSRFLTPGLIVIIAQHPDSASSQKYLKLVKDSSSPTGDRLAAKYFLSDDDEQEWDRRDKQYMSTMRKLGTFPIKRIKTEHGSAIHYAGTVPFSDKSEKLHLSSTGRLHKTKHVYVADSSGFRYLPAKGLTFTLMANAHLVAENVIKENEL